MDRNNSGNAGLRRPLADSFVLRCRSRNSMRDLRLSSLDNYSDLLVQDAIRTHSAGRLPSPVFRARLRTKARRGHLPQGTLSAGSVTAGQEGFPQACPAQGRMRA
jgi:hypothetical protein